MLEKSVEVEVEKLIEEYECSENRVENMMNPNLADPEENFVNNEKYIEDGETQNLNENEEEDLNENSDENMNNEIEENEDDLIDKYINQKDTIIKDEKISVLHRKKKSNLIKKQLRKKYQENIKKFFFKQSSNNIINEGENENSEDIDENINEEVYAFSRLKRLKKKSDLIKEKEITKKTSFKNFFEVEAELGSDNEEHDDVVKKLNQNEIEEEEENAEEDLKDLINDIGDEESEEDIQDKYFSDMLQIDREELKQVIEGPKRKILNRKRMRDNIDDNMNEEDLDLALSLRISKQNKSKQDDQENKFNMLFKNCESFEKRLHNSEENNENEEFKDMLHLYQHNIIKKIAEKSRDHKSNLLKRIEENEKILENVINLNNYDKNNLDKSKSSNLFIQGNSANSGNTVKIMTGLNQSVTNSLIENNNINGKPCLTTSMTNSSRMKFGSFLNSKNSFLHAMKNDKYYNKMNNEDVGLLSQNSAESNSSNSTATNSIGNNKTGSVPFFMRNSNSNAMTSNNKSTNLSCLFTRSSKPRHNIEPNVKKMRTPNKNEGNVFNLKKLLN